MNLLRHVRLLTELVPQRDVPLDRESLASYCHAAVAAAQRFPGSPRRDSFDFILASLRRTSAIGHIAPVHQRCQEMSRPATTKCFAVCLPRDVAVSAYRRRIYTVTICKRG